MFGCVKIIRIEEGFLSLRKYFLIFRELSDFILLVLFYDIFFSF